MVETEIVAMKSACASWRSISVDETTLENRESFKGEARKLSVLASEEPRQPRSCRQSIRADQVLRSSGNENCQPQADDILPTQQNAMPPSQPEHVNGFFFVIFEAPWAASIGEIWVD